MASPAASVYDFTSGENASKWRGILQPALGKIQKQVHPRMDIDDDAISYMEELVYHLLGQICSSQPHSTSDVVAYITKNFVVPINTWAINDAQRTMERHQVRGKGKSVFNFPVEKLHPLLEKEVFNHAVEVNVVRYIAAILDYIAADILKLAGNFKKNTGGVAIRIKTSDIQLSLSVDVALHSLFQRLNTKHLGEGGLPPIEASEESEQASSYDQLVLQLMSNEEKYICHLNLILKIFQEPFTKRPDLFPPEEVQKVFINLPELYGLSVQLLASLDECMEMAGKVEGVAQCSQAGFVFEEIAESEEFDVYVNYARTYEEAVTVLQNFMETDEAVEYLKTLTEPDLFKEAIQYVLPKSLMEPFYHFFYYFEVMNMLMKKSPSEEDQDAYEAAQGCMVGIKAELEKKCSGFLPTRKEEIGMQKPSYMASMKIIANVQNKIDGWEGSDLGQCCTEFIMEGSLIMMREGNRKKMERHVFLLDGLAVCCKPRQGGHEMYRFKEKINLRQVKLIEQQNDSDSTDMKYSFQLIEPEQLAYTFYFSKMHEKLEWMSALTHLLTKSIFDRKLNMKLKEEEQDIPQMRPHPEYRFAEEDMDENILFDEQEEGKFKSSNEALIKACTIHKLIERLTYHEYADPTLVRTFLMTYRSFCSPTKLLDLLIERFDIPLSDEVDDLDAKKDPLLMKAVKAFKANYVSPIQLRVFNVLRHWVDFHYYDFQRDNDLLAQLQSFIKTVKGKKMQKWVAALNRSLEKKRDEAPSAAKPVFSRKPEPVEWWVARKPEDFNVLSLHPKEIARQLTLIMAENFRAIHPSELVDASWMKETKKETASPNLLKHTRFETMVSNWLTKEIVYTENYEERVALVSRLIDIMAEMKTLNNFAGMFAINAAFQSSSVFRLTHTLKKVEGRKMQLLEEVKVIASSDRGFKNYKEKLRNINPPCVPFVGMYLTWIVFIRDGNEDHIPGMPNNFINFRKRRKLATVLQEIQQYQNTPYCIEPESSIQKFLVNQDPMGDLTPQKWEEDLFEQSRVIEPKDQPPKKAPRRWKFDLRGPGFLTIPRRIQHRPRVSQLSIDDDTDVDSQKSGSEPTSPSPHSVSQQRPMLPPKPKTSDLDLNVPDLPPRSPPVIPPRKPRGGKDNMLVQSLSYVDGLNSQPPSQTGDRHRSPSLDVVSLPVRYPPRKATAPALMENGSHYKPSLTPPALDTPTASSNSHLHHDNMATLPQGFGKPPAPPPPASSSSTHSGDYPPYDKLAPIGSNYERLIPITLPRKPTLVESVPPLPPRSATEIQPLPGKAAPPRPPKGSSPVVNSVPPLHGKEAPPLPPKGPSRGN